MTRAVDSTVGACLALAFAAALSGCVTPSPPGYFGPAPEAGPVECKDTKCPSAADFREAEEIFRSVYSDAKVLYVRVEWHPLGTLLTSYWRTPKDHAVGAHGYVANRGAPSANAAMDKLWIECSSWAGWAHERIHLHHVQIKRAADYHTGGPWTDAADNDGETRLKVLLTARFGGP